MSFLSSLLGTSLFQKCVRVVILFIFLYLLMEEMYKPDSTVPTATTTTPGQLPFSLIGDSTMPVKPVVLNIDDYLCLYSWLAAQFKKKHDSFADLIRLSRANKVLQHLLVRIPLATMHVAVLVAHVVNQAMLEGVVMPEEIVGAITRHPDAGLYTPDEIATVRDLVVNEVTQNAYEAPDNLVDFFNRSENIEEIRSFFSKHSPQTLFAFDMASNHALQHYILLAGDWYHYTPLLNGHFNLLRHQALSLDTEHLVIARGGFNHKAPTAQADIARLNFIFSPQEPIYRCYQCTVNTIERRVLQIVSRIDEHKDAVDHLNHCLYYSDPDSVTDMDLMCYETPDEDEQGGQQIRIGQLPINFTTDYDNYDSSGSSQRSSPPSPSLSPSAFFFSSFSGGASATGTDGDTSFRSLSWSFPPAPLLPPGPEPEPEQAITTLNATNSCLALDDRRIW
jgi:hypothetical protein